MSETDKQIAELQSEVQQLRAQVKALSAGLSAAIAAMSIGLRELSGEHKVMDAFLTYNLQHGWPTAEIPDNEVNEVAYALPLRLLLQDHAEAREFFRTRGNPAK